MSRKIGRHFLGKIGHLRRDTGSVTSRKLVDIYAVRNAAPA
jgi:hypothetical protein